MCRCCCRLPRCCHGTSIRGCELAFETGSRCRSLPSFHCTTINPLCCAVRCSAMVHMRRRVGERASKKGGSGAAVFLCGDFNGFPGNCGLLAVLMFLIFTRMTISEETPFIIHFLYPSFLHNIIVFPGDASDGVASLKAAGFASACVSPIPTSSTFPAKCHSMICQLPPTSMPGSCC